MIYNEIIQNIKLPSYEIKNNKVKRKKEKPLSYRNKRFKTPPPRLQYNYLDQFNTEKVKVKRFNTK